MAPLERAELAEKIRADLEWLQLQPPSPERDHVVAVLTQVMPADREAFLARLGPGAEVDTASPMAWEQILDAVRFDVMAAAQEGLREWMRLPFGGNSLSATTEIVAKAFRRTVLQLLLDGYRWDMPAVGKALYMGGTSNVIRAIRHAGLGAQHREARRIGLIKRGGRRPGMELPPRTGSTEGS